MRHHPWPGTDAEIDTDTDTREMLLDTVMDIGVRDGDGIRTNHAGGEEIHFDNEQFGQIDGDEVRVNILIITLAGRSSATLQLGDSL